VNANAQIPIRVLPDRPEVAIPLEAGDTWWSILTYTQGKGGVWVVIGFAAFALLSIPCNLAAFLTGRSSIGETS
jgi:hypothetical protein